MCNTFFERREVNMNKLSEFLSGKKTYIIAGLLAVITFAKVMGWLSNEQTEVIYGFLAALGIYSVRSAISKLE